uniref:WW domain-containing protein n=1 Tax=viral metagenome TaxID=1070528 RepID=A0A6C0BQY5_9ZZZZ
MEETGNTDIAIVLGDIIQITADDDEINGYTFIVEYIDETILDVVRDDGEKITLNMDKGVFTSVNVTDILIINRSEMKGYARQNGLVPGASISIMFDNGYKIKGDIIDLKEDRIEINLEDENIYIDFGYKGIPKEYQIADISITEDDEVSVQDEEVAQDEALQDEALQDEALQDEALQDEALQDEALQDEALQDEASSVKDDALQGVALETGLIFGDVIGKLSYEVTAPMAERIFGIDKQTTDMLNGFLSKIPPHKRTPDVMDEIMSMIDRYTELRDQFSSIDDNYNFNIPDEITSLHKPSINSILNLDKKLIWCLPVTDYKKKMYHTLDHGIDIYRDLHQSDLSESQGLILDTMEAYKSNSVPDGINNHHYRISNIDKEFNPLYPPDNEVLYVNGVKNNIFALSDTSGDFMSNNMAYDVISASKFVGNEYVTKLTTRELSKIRGETHITLRDIVPSDVMYIKSMITLPMSIIPVSNVTSGHASILNKSNLDEVSINYWKIFNDNTEIDTIDVTDAYTADNNMETIRHFRLPDGFSSGLPPFGIFLDSVIPSTSNIIRNYSAFTFNNTLCGIVRQLEPFMIQMQDINYNHYTSLKELTSRFNDKFKQKYAKRRNVYYAIPNERNMRLNRFYSLIFHTAIEISDSYPFINRTPITSELYAKMMNIDDARSYHSLIRLMNSELYIGPGANTDEMIVTVPNSIPKSEVCDRILSKTYDNVSELETDNGIVTYYDKQYDSTLYEVTDEYHNELEVLPSQEERNEFIYTKLISDYKLSPEDAIRETKHIAEGRKMVSVGDYAVVKSQTDGNTYYKRTTELMWEQDDELSGDDVSFCNVSSKCISIKGKCMDASKAPDIIDGMPQSDNAQTNPIDMIYPVKSAEELTSIISLNITMARIASEQKVRNRLKYDTGISVTRNDSITKSVLPKGWTMRYSRVSSKFYYYNRELNVSQVERPVSTTESIFVKREESPYAMLRDEIIAQTDFSKKQSNIVKFSSKYARPSRGDEDPYWFYCNKSNIKLIPVFMVKLADAYTTGGDYDYMLRVISSEQGVISGNGGHIVDKYSGYIIMSQPFDTSDSYNDDGFKEITRSIMEKDIGEVIMEGPRQEVYGSREELQITNIIKILLKSMSIVLPEDRIHSVLLDSMKLLSDVDTTLRIQANKSEVAKQKRSALYNKSMVIITLSYLHIYIQTTIPTIKSKASYPGCKSSFGGYPTHPDEANIGIEYISCIANNLKSQIDPWSGIAKMSRKSISDNIHGMIDKFILPHHKIKEMIESKLHYQDIDDVEPSDIELNSLSTFLPPLVETHTKPIDAVPRAFVDDITQGSVSSLDKVYILKSKLIQIAGIVREKIQGIVHRDITKNNPVLVNHMGEPYNQNACCYSNTTPNEYFTNESSDVKKYLEMSLFITEVNEQFRKSNKPVMIFDDTNTRRILKKIDVTTIPIETIYGFIISRCRYDTDAILPPQLNGICLPRPPDYDPYSTLSEKIEKLRSSGHDYNEDTMRQVSVKTTTYNKVNLNETARKNRLMHILREISENDNKMYPSELLKTMYNLFDPKMADKYENNVRTAKDYLSRQIKQLTDKLVSILSDSGLSRRELNKIMSCLHSLFKFPDTGTGMIVDIPTETNVRQLEFTKSIIEDISIILPHIVLNNGVVDYSSIKPPKHWKLSGRHVDDFVSMIRKYYEPMSSFYTDELFSEVLTDYIEESKDVYRFISSMTYRSSVEYDTDVMDPTITMMMSKYSTIVLLLRLNELAHLKGDSGAFSDKHKIIDMTSRYTIKLLNMVCHNKESIDYNYESLMSRIRRAKEKEKDIITDYLKDMSEDARKVEKVFKQYKLGKWSLGEQKGYREYQGDMYDKERDEMDEQLQREITNGTTDVISKLNSDIYSSDDLARIQEDMENNDLSKLGEDNDNAGEESDED